MATGDAQTTLSANVNASILRPVEPGRVVPRSARSRPDDASVPSFADSLVEASREVARPVILPTFGPGSAGSQPTSTRPAGLPAGTLPTISLIRPEGRHLGPVHLDADGNVVAGPASSAASPAPAAVLMPTAADSALAAATMADLQAAAAATRPASIMGAAATITGGSDGDDLFIKAVAASDPTTAAASVAATGSTASASVSTPAHLKEYPRPSRSDRSGVLSWNSVTPPTGRDLDRLISEARHRKAGWVTFVADPTYPEDYVDLADRLRAAGIQPIARVQDPEGDLPARDVRALVTELKAHGVSYYQLFDGANVSAETPDGYVDVREYADRWLPAARAVVEAGGLPGIGALDPHGDYDDRGFMRQLLGVLKEKGGADALNRSWLALRGETPGAAATPDQVDDLADRASWFDRINRRELGRSLPILATSDPSVRPERLTAETASTQTVPAAADAEAALRDQRRKLPALFGASRGTLAAPRH